MPYVECVGLFIKDGTEVDRDAWRGTWRLSRNGSGPNQALDAKELVEANLRRWIETPILSCKVSWLMGCCSAGSITVKTSMLGRFVEMVDSPVNDRQSWKHCGCRESWKRT